MSSSLLVLGKQLQQTWPFIANCKSPISRNFKNWAYFWVASRYAETVRKVQGGAVKDELGENFRWMILFQDPAHWLHLGNTVHELRVDPAPDIFSCQAWYQDMLDWISWCFTEITSLAQVWLVKMKPLIGQEVTCEELEMVAQLLHILGGGDVPECRVGRPGETT